MATILKNSTAWGDAFLIKALLWCCNEVGYDPNQLREAAFRKLGRRSYRGHAHTSRRISVSVGPQEQFPCDPDTRPGMDNEVIADRIEALVAVTTHELAHLCQYRDGRIRRLKAERKTEHDARWHEVRALRAFRQQREALLAKWDSTPAKPARTMKPSPTVTQRREAAARKAVEKWQRKLKLAQTKLKKYRAKVRYYDKRAAVASQTPSTEAPQQ